MRNLFLFFLCFSLTGIAFAKQKSTEEITILSGIAPDSLKSIIIEITDFSKTGYIVVPSVYNCEVKDGLFKFVFKIDHPVYFNINHVFKATGAFNSLDVRMVASGGFLIEPGDSIVMNTRANSELYFSNIPISGRGAEKDLCIQAIIRNTIIFDQPIDELGNFNRLGLYDSINIMIIKNIDLYKPKMSKTAITLIKAEYISMLNYDISEILRGDVNGIPGLNLKDIKVVNKYKQYLTKSYLLINPKDPSLIYCSNFYDRIILKQRALIEYSIANKISYPNVKENFKYGYYDALTKYLIDGPIKQKAISFFLQDRLSGPDGVNFDLKKAIQHFLKNSDSSTIYYSQVKERYEQWNSRLQKGVAAYPFVLEDTTGKVHSLAEFIGKVILIDFMFNNCPGCRYLTPYLTKIEKHYQGRSDIVFLSISVDRNKDSWKEGIGKSSVTGSLQLNTGLVGADHPITKYYNIVEYPRIILIDEYGKLITASAPDPRNDEGAKLYALINSSLQINKN